jgi:hypothetical protein
MIRKVWKHVRGHCSAGSVCRRSSCGAIDAGVNQGWPSYAAEQRSDVAQSDEIAPDDTPEQKRGHKEADKRSVKREQKRNEPACAQPCPATWPRYELTPWPL